MKQLHRSSRIHYRWWRTGEEDIKEQHIPTLERLADEHITAMRAEGFSSGELLENVRATEDDPEEGVEYRGWWECTSAGSVEAGLADRRLRQHGECAEKVAAGTADPLDTFIVENEPAGFSSSIKFRAELGDLLDWLSP